MEPSLTPQGPQPSGPTPALKPSAPAPQQQPRMQQAQQPPQKPPTQPQGGASGGTQPTGGSLSRLFRRAAIAGAVALTLVGGAFIANTPPADEYKYPAFGIVQELGNAQDGQWSRMSLVPKGAPLTAAAAVNQAVLDEDTSPQAMAVVEAAKAYAAQPTLANQQAFSAAVSQAQTLPQPAVKVGLLEKKKLKPIPDVLKTVPPVTLEPGNSLEMAKSLAVGQSKMFRLFIYDNAAQDGDIIELFINGRSFSKVPITNAGATLSVPLNAASPTSIAMKGIFDGGGGITVSLESSAGSYHTQCLGEGQLVHIGVVGAASGAAR